MILSKEEQPKAPYVHQSHPKVMYGPDRSHQVVADVKAEKALGPEWTDTPHPPVTDDDEPELALAPPVARKSKKK